MMTSRIIGNTALFRPPSWDNVPVREKAGKAQTERQTDMRTDMKKIDPDELVYMDGTVMSRFEAYRFCAGLMEAGIRSLLWTMAATGLIGSASMAVLHIVSQVPVYVMRPFVLVALALGAAVNLGTIAWAAWLQHKVSHPERRSRMATSRKERSVRQSISSGSGISISQSVSGAFVGSVTQSVSLPATDPLEGMTPGARDIYLRMERKALESEQRAKDWVASLDWDEGAVA